MTLFEKEIEVRWSDVDQNGHVRHSVYYDYGAFMRIQFMSHLGFDTEKLRRLNMGPILFKEECTFIREIKPNDVLRITMHRDQSFENGSRWKFHHELFNQNGEKVAQLTVYGAWMNLIQRKLTDPPEDLAKAFRSLPSTQDYLHKKAR